MPLQQPSISKKVSGDFTNEGIEEQKVSHHMGVRTTKINQATKGRDFPTPRPGSPKI